MNDELAALARMRLEQARVRMRAEKAMCRLEVEARTNLAAYEPLRRALCATVEVDDTVELRGALSFDHLEGADDLIDAVLVFRRPVLPEET